MQNSFRPVVNGRIIQEQSKNILKVRMNIHWAVVLVYCGLSLIDFIEWYFILLWWAIAIIAFNFDVYRIDKKMKDTFIKK